MKIIIVGNGKVGFTLAEHLSQEEHDITVIDTNAPLSATPLRPWMSCVSKATARPFPP